MKIKVQSIGLTPHAPLEEYLEKKLEEIEKYYIQQALKQTQRNLTNAAKLLNISFRSIRYKVQKFKIDV